MSAIDDAGNVTYADGAVVEGGVLADGAVRPPDAGTSEGGADATAVDAAKDATAGEGEAVPTCSKCGPLRCCSVGLGATLYCRAACSAGEFECNRTDAGVSAINCEGVVISE